MSKSHRPSKLTVDQLVWAYEMHFALGVRYEILASELKVNRDTLNRSIIRCERHGLSWVSSKVIK